VVFDLEAEGVVEDGVLAGGGTGAVLGRAVEGGGAGEAGCALETPTEAPPDLAPPKVTLDWLD
jgi:hypothetical protein